MIAHQHRRGSTQPVGAAGDAGFARIAYRLLVEERQAGVREVAEALGLSYSAFYARLRGRVPFRPEEARALIALLPDPRLVDYLLVGTPFVAAPRARVSAVPARDGLRDELVGALRRTAGLLEELGERREGQGPEVGRRLLEAERTLASLRRRLAREVASVRHAPREDLPAS